MTFAIAAQAKPLLVTKIDEFLKAKTAIVYVREWARKRGIVVVYMTFYNWQRRSMTAAKSAALRRFHTAMGTAGGATALLLMSLAEKGEMFVARVRYVLERGVRRRRWKAVLVEHPHPRVSLVASAWSNGRNG
jgi:hypothetical protein